ncbi:hypothetical protein TERMP_00441 [Thermococcus barophilus MP]|uniref:Uncharacterized protein n=1 Tax=Thermococcus barophilus (strain DSM 11836 / MP) TaxID=391623 RepID=F0LJF2_THEBM|nr:hypothetical protein TERMP_00441 [Thermococcus barophilus MP]
MRCLKMRELRVNSKRSISLEGEVEFSIALLVSYCHHH